MTGLWWLPVLPCNQNKRTHKANTYLLRQRRQNYRTSFKMKILLTADCMLCISQWSCFSVEALADIWEWMRQSKSWYFFRQKDGRDGGLMGVRVMEQQWAVTNTERHAEKRRKTRRRGNVIGVITSTAETRCIQSVCNKLRNMMKLTREVMGWENRGRIKKRTSDSINKTNANMSDRYRASARFHRVVQSACLSVSASLFWVRVVYSCADNISKTHLWTHATALSHRSTHGYCHHTTTKVLL